MLLGAGLRSAFVTLLLQIQARYWLGRLSVVVFQ